MQLARPARHHGSKHVETMSRPGQTPEIKLDGPDGRGQTRDVGMTTCQSSHVLEPGCILVCPGRLTDRPCSGCDLHGSPEFPQYSGASASASSVGC
jgi:hypothetical protein